MPRRFVTALVLVGYIAQQGVVLGLAQGSHWAQQQQRPHLHLDCLAALFATDWGRQEVGAHHHHGHSHSHTHEANHSLPTPPVNHSHGDHDDDCVYLPSLALANVQVRVEVNSGPIRALPASQEGSGQGCQGAAPPSQMGEYATAEFLQGHCALFLTLRTLRI